MKAKFKALRNIENKIAELSKSGKKVITGATQAIPKVVAMSSTPGASPGASGPVSGGSSGGGSSGANSSAGSSSGGDGASGDSSTDE